MMILVISDSHGTNQDIKELIDKVGKIDMLIHLGDIGREFAYIESLVSCPVHMIKGNNDAGVDLPRDMELMIGNYHVFLTHGHNFYVNSGADTLYRYGVAKGYDIVMYGHTHVPFLKIEDEMTILNPGSISCPRQEGRLRSYMLIELDDEGKLHYMQSYLEGIVKPRWLF